jgi:hypothetical protein
MFSLQQVLLSTVVSMYTGLTSPSNETRSRRPRALLTLVSLIVKVVTI